MNTLRISPYFVALALTAAPFANAQTTLNVSGADYNTSTSNWIWNPIRNSDGAFFQDTKADNTSGVLDQQTGQPVSDIVGNRTTTPTVYMQTGTINGVEAIGFRMRLNEFGNTNTLNQMTYIGIDLNYTDGLGKPDIVVGLDFKTTNTGNIVILGLNPTSNNTGPSDTGILYGSGQNGGTPYYNYSSSGTNRTFSGNSTNTAALTNLTTNWISYMTVNSTNSAFAGQNLTFSSTADALMSWAVPFNDFKQTAEHIMNTLVAPGGNYTFTSNSTFKIWAGTSNNQNNLNQDVTSDFGVAFTYTPPITSSGVAPIPEPATYAQFLALLGLPAFAMWLRRRQRG